MKKHNSELIPDFKKFVSENKNKSYSLCYRILRDADDAEDALQEAFLRFYKALKEGMYKETSNIKTYFYSIVYNTAVEFYRKKKLKDFNIKSFVIVDSHFKDGDEFKNFDEYISSITSKKSDTEKSIHHNEIKEIVKHFLDLLPEHYSTILTMNYINELSLNEISEILGIPLGTVKNRIFRAKEKFRNAILSLFTEKELSQYLN